MFAHKILISLLLLQIGALAKDNHDSQFDSLLMKKALRSFIGMQQVQQIPLSEFKRVIPSTDKTLVQDGDEDDSEYEDDDEYYDDDYNERFATATATTNTFTPVTPTFDVNNDISKLDHTVTIREGKVMIIADLIPIKIKLRKSPLPITPVDEYNNNIGDLLPPELIVKLPPNTYPIIRKVIIDKKPPLVFYPNDLAKNWKLISNYLQQSINSVNKKSKDSKK